MATTKKTTPAKKPAAKKAAEATADQGFSTEEKAAVKQAAAEKRRTSSGKNTEADVLAAIEAMDAPDKQIATGLHALVKRIAPELHARTWYGFPAYAKEPKGPVIFFYQFAGKFKTRYGTLGFNHDAALDDGTMWPVTYALTTWDDDIEKKVAALIEQAIA
ncbi:DUF1801 domain-containing protein [Mariniluteicoccus endophyticus]